jgi:hypothetical protein
MTPILPTPSSHPAPQPTGREERKERKKRKKKVNHPFIAHSRSTHAATSPSRRKKGNQTDWVIPFASKNRSLSSPAVT